MDDGQGPGAGRAIRGRGVSAVSGRRSEVRARQLHESWSLLWGFPRYCMTAASASLANSVAIRCAHDSSYHPGNLTLTGCNPAATYTVVPVVPAAGA